jgi:hypothetical protein
MLANVVPASHELLTHLDDQQVYQSSHEHPTPHLVTAINSVWTKLIMELLEKDTVTELFAVTGVLNPNNRIQYLLT